MSDLPTNAEEYEAYKRSPEYLEEHMRCSIFSNGLTKIKRQLDRGMLSSEDVVHMLSELIGEVEERA